METAVQPVAIEQKLDLVLRELSRVKDQLANPAPQPLSVSSAQAMVILGCTSDSALYRELADIGVRAYRPGKYRLRDLENGLAKTSFRAHQPIKKKEIA